MTKIASCDSSSLSPAIPDDVGLNVAVVQTLDPCNPMAIRIQSICMRFSVVFSVALAAGYLCNSFPVSKRKSRAGRRVATKLSHMVGLGSN